MGSRSILPTIVSWLTGGRRTPPPPPTAEPEEGRAAPLSLADVARSRQEAMQRAEEERAWQVAARAAADLCNVLLVMGEWSQVLATSERGEKWLARQEEPLIRLYLRTQWATAQHRLGGVAESRAAFQEAEQWQVERKTGYHWLIGLPGKAYCDLLLEQARETREWEMVLHRSQYSQKVVKNQFAVAMDLQVQGRALAALGQVDTARATFKHGVVTLRKANRRSFLPNLLLYQAAFLRRQGEEGVQPALEEALAIAVADGLRPAEADGRLLAGHLLLDEGRLAEAEAALLAAEALIDALGYGQRLAEANLLRARLLQKQGRLAEAEQWRAQGMQRVERLGQWGVVDRQSGVHG
ncbi:MAG: hypothetical protein H7835_11185 [Magnetococcus sp. XQGC-1]